MTWDTLPMTGGPVVTPCTNVLGAVVVGVDLRDLGDEDFAADPNFQVRWRGRADDVAIWDERCTNPGRSATTTPSTG